MGEILGGELAEKDPDRAVALMKLWKEPDMDQMKLRAAQTALLSWVADESIPQAQQMLENTIRRKCMSGLTCG